MTYTEAKAEYVVLKERMKKAFPLMNEEEKEAAERMMGKIRDGIKSESVQEGEHLARVMFGFRIAVQAAEGFVKGRNEAPELSPKPEFDFNEN